VKGKKEPHGRHASEARREEPAPPDEGAPPDGPPDARGATAAPATDPVADELERLRAREDELLRALAELQNVQRRRRQELDLALLYAHEPLVRALLPVLDDLERAAAATEGREADPLAAGVRIVLQNLRATLDRDGLVEIRPVNGAFDPELHDALLQRPASGVPPHTVLEVVKPGYRYRDHVLRHAQVVVSADDGPGAAGGPPAADEPGAAGGPASAPVEGDAASKPPEEGTP
jgi:molecular chaperone GrpE